MFGTETGKKTEQGHLFLGLFNCFHVEFKLENKTIHLVVCFLVAIG
jgi:hypothetical protein